MITDRSAIHSFPLLSFHSTCLQPQPSPEPRSPSPNINSTIFKYQKFNNFVLRLIWGPEQTPLQLPSHRHRLSSQPQGFFFTRRALLRSRILPRPFSLASSVPCSRSLLSPLHPDNFCRPRLPPARALPSTGRKDTRFGGAELRLLQQCPRCCPSLPPGHPQRAFRRPGCLRGTLRKAGIPVKGCPLSRQPLSIGSSLPRRVWGAQLGPQALRLLSPLAASAAVS